MWDNQDAVNLKNFYFTTTGKRFLEQVKAIRPKIPDDSFEKSALAAQRVGQHDLLVTLISEILTSSQEEASGESVTFIPLVDPIQA